MRMTAFFNKTRDKFFDRIKYVASIIFFNFDLIAIIEMGYKK